MAASPASGPQEAERLLALLGLARRAGKLALGVTAVEKLVRQGRRPVVVLASDAGGDLRRRLQRWEPLRGLVADLVSRAQLAERLGRQDLAVVAVADEGFVHGMMELGVVADPGLKRRRPEV